jgi:hypothetical protein
MHAFRSPFRLFIIGLVGLTLIVVAIDIMFLHELSTAPDGSPGQLTTRGQAEQRGDIIWGAALIGMGVVLLGSSLVELFRHKPVVDVRDDGLYAQIGANVPEVLIPWRHISQVRSGVVEDPFDGSVREELIVTVADQSVIPAELTGAAWSGADLHIDAHDWNRPVTDIALAAQGARNFAVRPSPTMAPMGEPAMMWETIVDVTREQEDLQFETPSDEEDDS